MPEGDTIFRTARTLERALREQPVERFQPGRSHPKAHELVGQRIVRVESRGKNLLLHFEEGMVLYTHMRMTGSWHLYRAGESWRRPQRQANLAIHTPRHVAVCFNAPVVELLTARQLRWHRFLSRLGPDLLAEEPDFEEMTRRLVARPDDPIGVALLRQEALCGIGNVYKSETLFLEGVDPFARLGRIAGPSLASILRTARTLMLANLTGYPRITRRAPQGSRYWVYGRLDAPCFRCETPIRMRRQGDAGRSTYWCPACQAAPVGWARPAQP